jgi:DNA-binding HxlR family transcriptional regulator
MDVILKRLLANRKCPFDFRKFPARVLCMKSYGQTCALAKALDVVGDRWSLLVIRELLIRGSLRYTDIRKGVPGIATNLLANRLRELEEAGVVRREAAPPPIATTLYHLTPRGEDLRPVVIALGRWGQPLLADAGEDEAFQTHWLTLPLEANLKDNAPEESPIAIQVRAGDEPLLIETIDGAVRARVGSTDHPDAVLSGPSKLVFATLVGRMELVDARAKGLIYEGDPALFQRVRPGASASV